jgi:hypothetical protein
VKQNNTIFSSRLWLCGSNSKAKPIFRHKAKNKDEKGRAAMMVNSKYPMAPTTINSEPTTLKTALTTYSNGSDNSSDERMQ